MTRPRAYEVTPIGYVLNPDGLPRTSRIDWRRYVVELGAFAVALTFWLIVLALLIWAVPRIIAYWHLERAPWPAIAGGVYVALLLAWPFTRPDVRRGGR